MARPNIALKSLSGTDKERFREFERLLGSIIGVAAVAGDIFRLYQKQHAMI